MYCPNCGNQNPDDAVNCSFCGNPLNQQKTGQPDYTKQQYSENPNLYDPNQNSQIQNNQYQGNQYVDNPYQNNQYQSNQYQNNPYQNNMYQNNANNTYYSGQGQNGSAYVENNLVLSIVGLVLSVFSCCCFNPASLILSIIAVVFSAQVNGKVQMGDIAGAEKNAKNAKTLSWISIGLIILFFIGYILLYSIGAIPSHRSFDTTF